MNRFDNIDCMDKERGMPSYPDKHFDLAIVDPPYGIGESKKDIGRNGYGAYTKRKAYEPKEWDGAIPDDFYFTELFRVSRNQIIWGANYYGIKGGYIFWDKDNGDNDFSDGELAYQSFTQSIRKFKWRWNGMLQERMDNKEERIHPTQKPIALYKWLLTKYAKQGDLILDTHVGSASSLIACEDMGFEYVGFELDSQYFEAANKRLENFRKQLKLEI